MFITVVFQTGFENVAKDTTLHVDPDYNESIENVKVLITLQCAELEMDDMKLYFHGKRLRDHERINSKGITQGDIIHLKRKGAGCVCF